jgi:hypothetical protein
MNKDFISAGDNSLYQNKNTIKNGFTANGNLTPARKTANGMKTKIVYITVSS